MAPIYLCNYTHFIPLFSTIRKAIICCQFQEQNQISHLTLQLALFCPNFLYSFEKTVLFISTIFVFPSHFSLQLRISQSFSTTQSKAKHPIKLYKYHFFVPFFSTITVLRRKQSLRAATRTYTSHFSLQLMPANPVFSAFCIFLHYSSRFSLQLDRIVSTTSPLFLTEIFPIFSTSSPYCFHN